MKKFITYGISFDPERFEEIKNGQRRLSNKPDGGLWASPVKSGWSWRDFCRSEGYHRSDRPSNVWTKFVLAQGTRIYTINTLKDLITLQSRYPLQPRDAFEAYILRDDRAIDFEALKEDYDGVYLTEQGLDRCRKPDCKFKINLYNWDCECILMFRANKIKVLEVRD